MINRALTPVANVSGEGMGRPELQVDNVDHIQGHTKKDGLSSHKLLSFYICNQMSSCFLSFRNDMFIVLQCLHTDDAIWRKNELLVLLLC